MNDDLILLLDTGEDIVLEESVSEDIILMDDSPYSKHYDEYEGTYTVRPILYDSQVLHTDEKVMKDDVTVLSIPIVYTSNVHDGKTVVIG